MRTSRMIVISAVLAQMESHGCDHRSTTNGRRPILSFHDFIHATWIHPHKYRVNHWIEMKSSATTTDSLVNTRNACGRQPIAGDEQKLGHILKSNLILGDFLTYLSLL